MKPLLSIITIAKNADSTIRQTLDSVASQRGIDFQRIEHWLIDGCSTDQTLSVAALYPHLKISSEKDSGIASAFNRGIAKANGDWIVFLNSDDYLYDQTVISDLIYFLEAQSSETMWGYGAIEVLDAPARRWGHADSWKKLSRRMSVPHPAVFMRREFFKKIGLFKSKYRIAMDYELVLRAYKVQHPVFLDRVLVCFATGGASGLSRPYRQAYEVYLAKKENQISSEPKRLVFALYQLIRFNLDKVYWMKKLTDRYIRKDS